MANQELPDDPPPSMSAAELRRRLLASTPPPVRASSVSSVTLDELAAISRPGPRPGGLGRLTMPGAHGPVSASDLPPVAPLPMPDPPPARPRPLPPDSSAAYPGIAGGSVLGMPSPLAADLPPAASGSGSRSGLGGSTSSTPEDQVRRLKQENRELRKLLDEMKQLLQEASDGDQQFSQR